MSPNGGFWVNQVGRHLTLRRTFCNTKAMAAAANPIRVLFCGDESYFPTAAEYTRNSLQKYPHIQVDTLAFKDIPKNIHNYEMCVVRMMRLDKELISCAKKLKLICQFGVGLEGVDIQAATEAGIKVGKIPGDNTGNALSCAEHAIYLILGLLREQKGMEKAFIEKKLGVPTGQTLYGKTVLIVGYGNIGKELALRLRAFGVRILATKRSWEKPNSLEKFGKEDANFSCNPHHLLEYLKQHDDLVDEKGDESSLYEFASRADIIFLCCVLTPQTVGMVNSEFLGILKKGAMVVNVARGGLLNYDAVRSAVESGHLGGLGIDVAWYEPFDPEDELLKHPKVLITPHVAGVTEISYRSMANIMANCAVDISQGTQPSGITFVN